MKYLSLDVLLSSARERKVISIIEEYLGAPISNTRVHQPVIRTDLDSRKFSAPVRGAILPSRTRSRLGGYTPPLECQPSPSTSVPRDAPSINNTTTLRPQDAPTRHLQMRLFRPLTSHDVVTARRDDLLAEGSAPYTPGPPLSRPHCRRTPLVRWPLQVVQYAYSLLWFILSTLFA